MMTKTDTISAMLFLEKRHRVQDNSCF